MGMDQTVGVAYGIAFSREHTKAALEKIVEVMAERGVTFENEDAVEDFYFNPDEGGSLVTKTFPLIEVTGWFDEEKGEKYVLFYARGTLKSVTDRWHTEAPVALKEPSEEANRSLEELAVLLAEVSPGSKSIRPAWRFYAYVW